MYVTPRTLLAIIRLAQAMAKLQFRDEVKQSDVDEAIKLMDYSIRSLRTTTGEAKTRREGKKQFAQEDRMGQVMGAVREIVTTSGQRSISVLEILKRIKRVNSALIVEKEELEQILDYYKKMQVVYINPD